MVYFVLLLYNLFFGAINELQIIKDYKYSDVVITASIINIAEIKNEGAISEFEAVQIFKGSVHKTYLVKTNSGFNFKKGTKFLLYLKKKENTYYTIVRYETKENEKANDEIEFVYNYVQKSFFRKVKTPSSNKYIIEQHSWL